MGSYVIHFCNRRAILISDMIRVKETMRKSGKADRLRERVEIAKIEVSCSESDFGTDSRPTYR